VAAEPKVHYNSYSDILTEGQRVTAKVDRELKDYKKCENHPLKKIGFDNGPERTLTSRRAWLLTERHILRYCICRQHCRMIY
jgi:hypothetical protein